MRLKADESATHHLSSCEVDYILECEKCKGAQVLTVPDMLSTEGFKKMVTSTICSNCKPVTDVPKTLSMIEVMESLGCTHTGDLIFSHPDFNFRLCLTGDDPRKIILQIGELFSLKSRCVLQQEIRELIGF